MNRRKFIIILLSILFWFFLCPKLYAISSNQIENTCQKEAMLLDVAYLYQSETLLDYFFKDWINTNQKSSENSVELVSPYKDVYEIFSIFYQPDRTSREDILSNPSKYLGPDKDKYDELIKFVLNTKPFYPNAEYIIVQNEIDFKVLSNYDEIHDFSDLPSRKYTIFIPEDSIASFHQQYIEDLKIIMEDSINNFHPNIQYMDKKIIFNSAIHEKALNTFLIGELNDLVKDYQNKSEEEKIKISELDNLMRSKRNFISSKIQTAPYHWGGGWYYITFPIVYTIYFNEELNKAAVDFRDYWDSGGYALFEKTKEGWKQLSYENTWGE